MKIKTARYPTFLISKSAFLFELLISPSGRLRFVVGSIAGNGFSLELQVIRV